MRLLKLCKGMICLVEERRAFLFRGLGTLRLSHSKRNQSWSSVYPVHDELGA